MRRVPISIKLWAALAAPLIGLLTITIVEIAKASSEVDSVHEQAELATAAVGPAGVIDAIENERSFAVAALVGLDTSITLNVTSFEDSRQQTDGAVDEFRAEILQKGGAVAEAYRPALEALGALAGLRQEIDGNTTPRTPDANAAFSSTIFDGYGDLIAPFLDANTRVAVAIDNPSLRQGAELVDITTRQIEVVAELTRALFLQALSDTPVDRTEIAQIATWRDLFNRNIDTVQATDREPYRSVVAEDVPEELNTEILALADATIAGEQIGLERMLPMVNIPEDQQYIGFRDGIATVLQSDADDLAAEAGRRVWWYRVLAVAAIGVAALATWLVSRSITRPLRALTRQATEMANHRLPDAVLDILDTPLGDDVTVPGVDPIQVQTRDEVADVADALNTVQDSALDLAVEQAVLRRNIADSFVNLGRRNQNLLGRQLDFITELEHNETDSDTLANLFRLDHLATRMRRNAESLLVLAGIDPPRKWAAPVRITDAIRAALGEVEDYQRVTVRAVEPATILGSAAADLAHLLAELIENALIFSPPDQTVEIRGRGIPAGAPANGYTLAVIDSGLGMPPEELSRANRRLAGAESFTIAPSKYLGHYVAGNLAARHNINVTLHNSPGHGVTATINLPPTLLTSDSMGPAGQADSAPGAPQLIDPPPLGVPAPPPDAFPVTEPVFAPVPAAPFVDQTTSGLAKRNPHAPSHADAATTRPAATPDDDLLQTLAQYTTQLHDGPPAGSPTTRTPSPSGQPDYGSPVPPTPQPDYDVPPLAPPHQPDLAPSARGDGPELPSYLLTPPAGMPHLGGRARSAPPGRGDDRGSWGDPRAPLRPPTSPPPPQPSPPQPPPQPQSPPPPPSTQPPAPTTPAARPPRPARRADLAPAQPPARADRNGRREPPTPPAVPPPQPAGDQQTPGGLTRRVRGAQMPNTDLVGLRRGEGSAPAPAPPQAPTPPEAAPRRKASSGPPASRPRRLEGRDTSIPYRSPSASTSFERPRSSPPAEASSPPPPPPPPPPVQAPEPVAPEPVPPAPAAPSATDSSNGDHRAADEVYSFLSSFTAGVQRGLDEAQQDPDDEQGESR